MQTIQSSTNHLNPIQTLWKKWLTIRATSPENAFREQTIRGMVPIMAAFILLGFGFAFGTNTLVILPILAAMAVIVAATILALLYNRLNIAALLMFLFPVVAAVGSLYSSGYLSTAGIVMSFFSVLFGAIILPRSVTVFLPFGMIIMYSIMTFTVGAYGPKVSDLAPSHPSGVSQSVEMMILTTLFFGIGYYLLNEFEARRRELTKLVTTLEDRVTERTRDLQTARMEAERANTVKSQFLASMSHELRTPLNAIINFTKFIRRELMGPVTPQQSSALEKVLNSAEHLLNLINDVLDISKIEAGALQLYVEADVNLGQELESVQAAGEALLEGKPVELRLELPDQLPLLTGDKQRIRQIILNLVSNACKFTEKGHITIKAQQSENHVLVTVEDTGFGIDPTQHEAIFETFRQADSGLKHGEGTGLGLPISLRLAQAHGGKLWLESKLNEGSTFYVSLPIKPDHLQVTF